MEWYAEHVGDNDEAISTLRILPPFATEYKITMNTHVYTRVCVCVMRHWRYPLTIICTIRHYVHVFDTKFRVHYQNAFIKLGTLQHAEYFGNYETSFNENFN